MTDTSQQDQPGPQYDPERVITNLEQQLGRSRGEAARLEAVIATLLAEQNTLARERDEALAKATSGE